MKSTNFNLEEEKRQLILARFKTLNPESKILLGGQEEVSVSDLIEHIEKNNDFGKKAVQVHISMLKILSTT